MRTAIFSGQLERVGAEGGLGDVCLEGYLPWGCPGDVSRGCLPGGCLPRAGVCPGGVYLGGGFVQGVYIPQRQPPPGYCMLGYTPPPGEQNERQV